MNLLVILLVLVIFVYFGGSNVPKVLSNKKEMLLGILVGLSLCLSMGVSLEGLVSDCDLEAWNATNWLSNCSDAVNAKMALFPNPEPQDFRGWGKEHHNCYKKDKAGRCGTCSWEIQDVDRFACD